MQSTIACLGPIGTYSHLVSGLLFKQGNFVFEETLQDAITAVQNQKADYAVIPVENNTGGTVTHAWEMVSDSGLNIVAEVDFPIHHCAMTNTDVDKLDTITTIYGHPQTFAQCQQWLKRFPSAQCLEQKSNGQGARLASENASTLAIASSFAARMYGFKTVVADVQDFKNNTTRFVVISRNNSLREALSLPVSLYKTSLEVVLHNQAGALFGMLKPFASHGIQLSRIESRPMRRGTWEYRFFVDVDGRASDEPLTTALKTVQEQALSYKVMGVYPMIKIDEQALQNYELELSKRLMTNATGFIG